MKVILSTLAGVSLATITVANIWQALEPWANQIITACTTTTHSGYVRTDFTGQPVVDRLLCMSVAYYQHILHDLLGKPIQRLMMGAYATVMTIMAIEGSRQKTQMSLLSLYPLFIMIANAIGLSTVFLLWIPLSLYYQHIMKDLASRSVKYARAFGFVTAVVLGFVLPSAYITSSWIEPNSRIEENMIAIWQFIPILIIPLSTLFEKLFTWIGSPIDELQDEALKKRLYIAEGKDAVERSYIILGTINMFIYLGSYLQVGWTGINLKEAIVMLYQAPGSLPSGLSFSDIGQLLTTRTVFIDYVVLWLAFIFWAAFSSGVIAGFFMALVSIAIGPGAAAAFYAYYREGQFLNLQEPTVVPVVNEEEDKEDVVGKSE